MLFSQTAMVRSAVRV